MSQLCVQDAFKWALNVDSEDPCTVASQLIQLCPSSGFILPALQNGTIYRLPLTESQNQCACSSVVYALVSVCAACQNAEHRSWRDWIAHCQNVSTPNFPLSTDISIPEWTIFDVQTEPSFDVSRARVQIRNSTSPVTGPSSATNTSIITVTKVLSTVMPKFTSAPTSASTSASLVSSTVPMSSDVFGTDNAPPITPTTAVIVVQTTSTEPGQSQAIQQSTTKGSNHGAIAGGTVAGVLVFVAVGCLFVWWFRRRQRSHMAPSAAYIATYGKSRPPTVTSHLAPLTERSVSFVSSGNPFSNSLYQGEGFRASAYSEP